MANDAATPCGALFGVMKRCGGMSYKELTGLVLSGKPLVDGRSPASRADDRTWVSRFIVHAPVGSLQERYFCDYGTAAMRILARLRSRGRRAMGAGDVLAMLDGEGRSAMEAALSACHQDPSPYRNMHARIMGGEGYAPDEKAEAAMVLFVAAGCSASARAAAAYALEYTRLMRGGRLATTPAASLHDAGEVTGGAVEAPAYLGLLRVEYGYVKGSPHWVSGVGDGTVVGALALGESDVSDVGPGVSARHVRIWRDGDGRWLAQGLGSRNGTVLVSGVDRHVEVVEPPADERDAESAREGGVSDALDGNEAVDEAVEASEEPSPVEIHPGDELVLAGSTTFALIAGYPE